MPSRQMTNVICVWCAKRLANYVTPEFFKQQIHVQCWHDRDAAERLAAQPRCKTPGCRARLRREYTKANGVCSACGAGQHVDTREERLKKGRDRRERWRDAEKLVASRLKKS